MNQDNQQVNKDVLSGISAQFEEVVEYYQQMVETAQVEKQEALVQNELLQAKISSLEVERDSLIESLCARAKEVQAAPEADPAYEKKIAELTAERDSYSNALKQADQRIRDLEGQLAAKAQEAPAPVAAPVEPVAEDVPAPVAAPVEPVVEEAPAPTPDFEQQKQLLREMEEELARIEEKLREDQLNE